MKMGKIKLSGERAFVVEQRQDGEGYNHILLEGEKEMFRLNDEDFARLALTIALTAREYGLRRYIQSFLHTMESRFGITLAMLAQEDEE
jgi:hypothetical protein